MSREHIQPQLLARNTKVEELVYSQPSVSVYRGLFHDHPAAIKVQYASYGDNWAKYEQEIGVMMGFDHACLVKLYDSCWISTETQCYLVIVSEWCNKDLLKDTQQRKAAQYYWQEEELWNLLKTLVSALVYMQKLSFAHRDIKPSNIFYATGMGVKLGDFGSAAQRRDGSHTVTVTGTPQYLSPLLRKALMDRQFRVVHNVYKSDVFSLGLTFLTIMILDYPQQFTKVQLTREEIEALVVSLRYSEELRRVVMWMVEPDEGSRCDFVMLAQYLGLEPAAVEEPETRTLLAPVQPSIPSSHLTSNSASLNTIVNPEARSAASAAKCVPACLRCGKPVLLYSSDSDRPVRLPCDPAKHQFCSGTCFLVFALNNEKFGLKCPVCTEEIPKELVDMYVAEIRTNQTLSVRGSRADRSLRGSESTNQGRRRGHSPVAKSCRNCTML